MNHSSTLEYSRELTVVTPAASAGDAARLMAERNIGAVIVTLNGRLEGICSERDIAQKVVALGRNPQTVTVAEIMTANPITIPPYERPAQALETMRRMGFRHLPVMDGERLVGMLSIRDLYDAVHEELTEDLRLRDHYIMGSGYSLAQ